MKKFLLLVALGTALFQLNASDRETFNLAGFKSGITRDFGKEAVPDAVNMLSSDSEPRDFRQVEDRSEWADLSKSERAFYIEKVLEYRLEKRIRAENIGGGDYAVRDVLAIVRSDTPLTDGWDRQGWSELSFQDRLSVLGKILDNEKIRLKEDIITPGGGSLLLSAVLLFGEDKAINLLSRWHNSWKKPKNELQALRRKRKREQIKKITALLTALGITGLFSQILFDRSLPAQRKYARFLSGFGASALTALPAVLRAHKKQQLIEQQIKSLQATSKR